MIELETFQKHIIFYCKGHYKCPKVDKGFFEGLKMIWAIRCGYDYELTSKDVLRYVANDMYRIIAKCEPERMPYLMELIHCEIDSTSFKPKDMTAIESIVWEYRSILQNMQVREKPSGKKRYQWIVNIGKPQKQLFNRILSGGGKYDDYHKVK